MKCSYPPCRKVAKSEAGFCVTCQSGMEFITFVFSHLQTQIQLEGKQHLIPMLESLQAAAMVAAGIRNQKASIVPKLVSPEGRTLV